MVIQHLKTQTVVKVVVASSHTKSMASWQPLVPGRK